VVYSNSGGAEVIQPTRTLEGREKTWGGLPLPGMIFPPIHFCHDGWSKAIDFANVFHYCPIEVVTYALYQTGSCFAACVVFFQVSGRRARQHFL